jgi:hypothetical protein
MKSRFWSPLAVLSLLVLGACNAQGPCERHYESRAEQQACMVGAEVEAEDVLRAGGASSSQSETTRACADQCGARYNDSRIPSGSDSAYFEAVAEMTRMLAACRDACRVRVKYEHDSVNRKEVPGCEMIGVGGTTRCN